MRYTETLVLNSLEASFCSNGRKAPVRKLTTFEIIEQIRAVQNINENMARQAGEAIRNTEREYVSNGNTSVKEEIKEKFTFSLN